MTRFKTIIATALVAGALGAAPASAAITTFATYTTIGSSSNMYWQKAGTAGGSLFTIATQASTTPGAVAVNFGFTDGVLGALGSLSASYTFAATTTASPANLSFGQLIQSLGAGSFSFTYTGASPLVVNNTTYLTGANLLSATFNTAAIVGGNGGSSGSMSTSTSGGATIVYSSDFLSFTNVVEQDVSISLTSITPALNRANASSSLRTFRAASSGQFSTDPAPIVTAVPEPAVWGLFVVGFGLVGLQVRRRQPLVVTH